MIRLLDLRSPIYARTAAYGHFGKKDYSWERLDDGVIRRLQTLL